MTIETMPITSLGSAAAAVVADLPSKRQNPQPVAVGDRFFSLTAIERSRKMNLRTGKNRTFWLCQCDCGATSLVWEPNLRNGNTKSCGCQKALRIAKARTKHGDNKRGASSVEYHTWCGIITRCTNSANAAYPNYGGRGIMVCARWRDSFEHFLADMGRRPSPKHSIDRRNNDGNYEPDNCRWATATEQARNKRKTKLNEAKAAAIRTDARPHRVIAGEVGVSHSTIGGIKRGRLWNVG